MGVAQQQLNTTYFYTRPPRLSSKANNLYSKTSINQAPFMNHLSHNPASWYLLLRLKHRKKTVNLLLEGSEGEFLKNRTDNFRDSIMSWAFLKRKLTLAGEVNNWCAKNRDESSPLGEPFQLHVVVHRSQYRNETVNLLFGSPIICMTKDYFKESAPHCTFVLKKLTTTKLTLQLIHKYIDEQALFLNRFSHNPASYPRSLFTAQNIEIEPKTWSWNAVMGNLHDKQTSYFT